MQVEVVKALLTEEEKSITLAMNKLSDVEKILQQVIDSSKQHSSISFVSEFIVPEIF